MDWFSQWLQFITRKHSSRMHTVHCSGSWGMWFLLLGRGVLPASGEGCASCFWGGCLPRGVSVQRGVFAQWEGLSAQGVYLPGCICPGMGVSAQGVNRMTERCLWKYYLAAPSLRTVIIPRTENREYLWWKWTIIKVTKFHEFRKPDKSFKHKLESIKSFCFLPLTWFLRGKMRAVN